VITTRRLLHGPGRAHGWPRLLTALAAPIALAATALVPSAAATTAQPASRTTTTTQSASDAAATRAATTATTAAATSGQGQRLLSVPGLDAPSYTVTLITGDQVRLTQAGPGQYTATGVPGSGPATQIDFQSQSTGQNLTSLQATPDEAAGLISAGQVDPGLFDLRWLADHGDTSGTAKIPVTVQYPPVQTDAVLRSDAGELPGATVISTTPATGEVAMTVAVSQAASFWAALTGQSRTAGATPLSTRPATLASGASRIWLTGHQISAAAGPQSQAEQPPGSQPLYTVTETITGHPAGSPVDEICGGQDAQGNLVYGRFCLEPFTPELFGLAGSGQALKYAAATGYNGQGACISETAAKPYPICNAWQLTYSGIPAGIYYAQAYGRFLTTDNAEGTLDEAIAEMDVPQFTVTGNTSITINAANAVPVTVTTPQPTWHNGYDSMEVTRVLPDSRSVFSISLEDLNGGLGNNWWAIPAPASDRATFGSYHFSPELSLTAPMVTAAVTAPAPLALHPVYPCDDTLNSSYWCVRFSGSHTLPLVYAGQGTRADFAKIDARGKLVLLRPCLPSGEPGGFPLPAGGACNNDGIFTYQQLVNAQSAGAAGVLLDAGTEGAAGDSPATNYPVPASYADVAYPGVGVPMPTALDDFPFAVIDASQAGALRGLLAKGNVSVTISDSGPTPYAYNLWFDQEAQLSASQHYTLTRGQLAQVSESYNYPCAACGTGQTPAPPVGIDQSTAAFEPDDNLASGIQTMLDGPRAIREYYGPLSPDLMWDTTPTYYHNKSFGQTSIPLPEQFREVFDQPQAPAITWNQSPVAPGAALDPPGPGVEQAQPNSGFFVCAGCRQGDTFWPVFFSQNGASPSILGNGPYGYAPGSIELYGPGGQEIQPTVVGNVSTFQLPAQQARYKLVTPGTTWDFTSAEPATDHTLPGTGCAGTALGISTAPCQADPLVFLDYNAGLTTANTITPGIHLLQVTGYHQDPSAPPVTTLKLWTSSNGGTTWQPARVIRGWNGTFKVIYTVPAAGTNGYISIKAQANDAAGNDISQVIDNAYAIAAAPARG